VVHFAVHVLASEPHAREVLLALSLRPSGENEFLTPQEIGTWRHELGLVVLSACSSGINQELPDSQGVRRATRYSLLQHRTPDPGGSGVGLMGLGSAWLTAGARAVTASHWTTPDDSGELFLAFYRHLARGDPGGWTRNSAAALRAAQIEMLRSASWRAQPAYWAAYYVVGKD
jgi:CHAT domain-containing protein